MKIDENKNRRILVVDDNESIHEDFRRILCSSVQNTPLDIARTAVFGGSAENYTEYDLDKCLMNFEVDCVFDGHSGLEKIVDAARTGKPYAVAFVDMRMNSNWDGLQTIDKLWKVQPSLQVVICTAYSDYSWSEIASKLVQTEKFLILKNRSKK